MQNWKPQFENPDKTSLSTLQSCIRTNDLELVGDGTHLTYFEMLGNFSFQKQEYIHSVDMWTAILDDLNIRKDCIIHVHPNSSHKPIWTKHGFQVVNDEECQWSDGKIGGYCCEVYWNGLELGNLVNTLNTMTDVGFGWERLLMVIEGKSRVDEISIFDQTLDPVTRDHVRTIDCLWDNQVKPGSKGRNCVCRRLIRRVLHNKLLNVKWQEWLENERIVRERCIQQSKKMWNRHKDKSPQWWWETCGLLPEDLCNSNLKMCAIPI